MNPNEASINGAHPALVMERAMDELRRGRAIQLLDGQHALLVAAIETMREPLLERLRRVEPHGMQLHITAQRAESVGLAVRPAAGAVAIRVPPEASLQMLRAAAGVAPDESGVAPRMSGLPVVEDANPDTAIRLAKLARLLPALLVVEAAALDDPGVLTMRIEDLVTPVPSARTVVELISRARVPLADALDCEVVLFRQMGELREHLAIVIGDPEPRSGVPVRLHSACLTGDVLGSLRCDCGDQLKRAMSRIASLGGGVLLYLDQEGRGIGLANKLRAYALQDTGLDTVDADQHLGFLPDERDYAVAAAVLRELGFDSIRLLTNNPAKISALAEHGIEVVGRLPLVATVNAYNQRYLKAKLDRAGHLAE